MYLKIFVTVVFIILSMNPPSCGGDGFDQPTKDSVNTIIQHKANMEVLAAGAKHLHRSRSTVPGVTDETPFVITNGYQLVENSHNRLITLLADSTQGEAEFQAKIDTAFSLNRNWLEAVGKYVNASPSFDEVALTRAWLQLFQTLQAVDQKDKEKFMNKLRLTATIRPWNQL